MVCTGRVAAGQKQPQKFLSSRLSFQQCPQHVCPAAHAGDSAVLVLLTALGCSTSQLDLPKGCKERDKKKKNVGKKIILEVWKDFCVGNEHHMGRTYV